MNEFKIPTAHVSSITYGKVYDPDYARTEEIMSIILKPEAEFSFSTDEWIRREDVERDYMKKTEVAKNYWGKHEVAELLRKRATNLRIQAGNHGAKTRYSEANRLQSRAAELEAIANGINGYGTFNIVGGL